MRLKSLADKLYLKRNLPLFIWLSTIYTIYSITSQLTMIHLKNNVFLSTHLKELNVNVK